MEYCKDIPTVNNNGNIVEINDGSATASSNFKAKITGQMIIMEEQIILK